MSDNYYNIDLPAIDLTKPVGCKFISTGEISLLIPQIDPDHKAGDPYEVKGYNWFNLLTGKYTSAVFYPSIEAAIKARVDHGNSYDVLNVNLSIEQ